ncbi:DedA family protein [Cryptosporangium aurantiacum]|uniref:Membrane protein DedA, SNARE-associated domain n=1 Tax=Cryptosporangium aurantiacum TaxID=134849 RepID=A0A1M7RN86_9ACTN|nr:DedA family protein [Cryptosporangium aurantiacum]SHN47568.1 membrane protein DedA, SNARE-associated domain [Cryptosporangium aurantiacum]
MLGDVLDWLQALPPPAVIAVAGLLVLGECTIGLGLVVPGESSLLVASTTATTAPRFLALWAVVTACAVLGDSIGYLIGRRYGPRLRETRMVRRYGATLWDRAADTLQRRGAWAVFFVRFLPAVRALTPAAAGSAGLAPYRFFPAAVLGATCWSLLHISLGAALGSAARRIEGVLSTGGYVIVGLLAVVLLLWAIRTLRRRGRPAEEPAAELTK